MFVKILYVRVMTDSELLAAVKRMGESRAEIAAQLLKSPLAPRRKLSPSALGMWFTNGHVPYVWRPAAMERLGRVTVNKDTAA